VIARILSLLGRNAPERYPATPAARPGIRLRGGSWFEIPIRESRVENVPASAVVPWLV
jgi:hypothetical protein